MTPTREQVERALLGTLLSWPEHLPLADAITLDNMIVDADCRAILAFALCASSLPTAHR